MENYVRELKQIKRLLRNAFKQKNSLKIKYYSLSSDEVKYRIIDVYKLHEDCIIAYCHLRDDERTFVIDRIIQAKLLDEEYEIPKRLESRKYYTKLKSSHDLVKKVGCPCRDSNPGHGLERAGCLAAALQGHILTRKTWFLKLVKMI